ncbi:NAD(P)/FAD-dependent oxidoreductase [Paenibacillus arenilitoris]|uniref:NAD(P)/FAD-dependent oxidoreductase n=1 Tax=Paenibacillus arenilitoris TaxID=2772299 RepID=A0A927CKX4_9BACL|nr:NAD(P)/FAD-dependent oxidoreductase [Paenibacillus arenilitoris]MBD2869439.1 NAD(P)/FAD-dependent oxidoreductase [Paenibacillus arenilitoris]
MTRSVDAAVLGAGVAGSAMAKALADRGWQTVLIDRQSFPRHKVCGEFMSPESRSTLSALGLAEAVRALGPSRIARVRLRFASGAEIEQPLPGEAWGISRYSLDAVLHAEARSAGVELLAGTAVTAVYPDGERYLVETKRGGATSALQARAVLCAWGANRRPGLPGYRPDGPEKSAYLGVKSHFRGIAMEQAVEMYLFPGGYLGLCQVEGGLVNAAALLERRSFAQSGKSVLDFIGEAARRHPVLAARLSRAEPADGTQAAVAPVFLSRRPRAWDGMPLLGDAASMLPPLCGDGMSMALRSAALCVPLAARYLRGACSLAEWQREYERAVRREFAGPLRWGGLLHKLLGVPSAGKWLAAASGLAPGLARGWIRATRLKPDR